MFITRKSLPRRTLLKGMGATLALPFLDAMVPALSPRLKAATGPRRAAFIYFSNGTVIEHWTPATTGKGAAYPTILKPFEPLRDSAVVVTGLGNKVEGTHPTASSGWLTGVSAKPTEGDDVYNNTSIDQVIAAKVGNETLLPSLEVATEDFSSAIGSCAGGYSCIYANTISWRTPTMPLPMEINPRAAFERMFGRAGTPAQRAARLRRQKSILDGVGRELGQLQGRVGTGDKQRLDEYLQHVREVEGQIQKAEKQSAVNPNAPEAPIGIPESHHDHLTVMFDLMALAWQSDVTRVATFYTSREASQLTYPEVGVTEPHHSISHHNDDPAKLAAMALVGVYYSQHVARFVEKLKAMPEGDGTVLDNSMVFFGNGMSNSDMHIHLNLPMIVLGGVFEGDRHVVHQDKPMANLWMTAASKFGIDMDSFGIGTEPLEI
jgi:hypothetical protein